jgi:uncharacterized protein (TIGR00730 family)
MKNIAIFCGSSAGYDSIYTEQATALGQSLARRNMQVVYGGAKVGLMGIVADAALEAGGKVIGVLPGFLKSKEIAHRGLSELIIVDSMHERKTKMHELCDGIIALPGGYGTLEELFEIITWAQLGLHQKPVGILNIDGFYNHLIALLETMMVKGFLKEVNFKMLLVSSHVEELLAIMEEYRPPSVGKWITEDKV